MHGLTWRRSKAPCAAAAVAHCERTHPVSTPFLQQSLSSVARFVVLLKGEQLRSWRCQQQNIQIPTHHQNRPQIPIHHQNRPWESFDQLLSLCLQLECFIRGFSSYFLSIEPVFKYVLGCYSMYIYVSVCGFLSKRVSRGAF